MDFMGQDVRRVTVQQRASMLLSDRHSASDRGGLGREDLSAEAPLLVP
jgi:hypothetical protein